MAHKLPASLTDVMVMSVNRNHIFNILSTKIVHKKQMKLFFAFASKYFSYSNLFLAPEKSTLQGPSSSSSSLSSLYCPVKFEKMPLLILFNKDEHKQHLV